MAGSTEMWTRVEEVSMPEAQQELKRLLHLAGSGNKSCADCGLRPSTCASVSAVSGVFICVECSEVHRSVLPQITKVKGWTGTDPWEPDELEQMRSIGNQGADEIYGATKIHPDSSKDEKQRFVVNKYRKLSFVSPYLEVEPKWWSARNKVSALVDLALPDAPCARRVPAALAASVVDMSTRPCCSRPCSSDGIVEPAGEAVLEAGCYSLEQLTDKRIWSRLDIKTTERESYLSAGVFQKVFGMSKEDLAKLPSWKRDEMKKKHYLF